MCKIQKKSALVIPNMRFASDSLRPDPFRSNCLCDAIRRLSDRPLTAPWPHCCVGIGPMLDGLVAKLLRKSPNLTEENARRHIDAWLQQITPLAGYDAATVQAAMGMAQVRAATPSHSSRSD